VDECQPLAAGEHIPAVLFTTSTAGAYTRPLRKHILLDMLRT